MGVPEWWRLANALLAMAALVYLLIDLGEIYDKMTKRRLYLTFALAIFLLAAVVASLEAILQSNPPGARTVLYSVGSSWCIIGLWISRQDRI